MLLRDVWLLYLQRWVKRTKVEMKERGIGVPSACPTDPSLVGPTEIDTSKMFMSLSDTSVRTANEHILDIVT